MTEQELAVVQKMASEFAPIENIAAALGIHDSTLRRRLLKENGLVIEAARICRLVKLSDYQNRGKLETPK